MRPTLTTLKTLFSTSEKVQISKRPSTLSASSPKVVLELQSLLTNPALWQKLDSLLEMVRQDRLELLANPETTEAEMHGHRAVANFIREFIDTIKPNLRSQGEAITNPQPLREGDPYMELSPDLDAPRDLTTSH